jgi:hypothetical protein
MTLTAKIAAFCRELGDESDNSLRALARKMNMESVFSHAEDSVKAGQINSELEDSLDALDVMVRNDQGQGLYPPVTRGYTPLPGPGGSSGAQWWTCPRNLCVGRGRVRAGQQPPVCAAAGVQLVPGPLPE